MVDYNFNFTKNYEASSSVKGYRSVILIGNVVVHLNNISNLLQTQTNLLCLLNSFILLNAHSAMKFNDVRLDSLKSLRKKRF